MAKRTSKKPSLKDRYRTQNKHSVRTAGAGDEGDPTHDDAGDDDGELAPADDDEGEDDDVDAEGYDDGAPLDGGGDDEEELDLDAFDLDDLGADDADGEDDDLSAGMDEDEMDIEEDDEEEDVEGGDVEIKHDEDSGDLSITHDGGDDDDDEDDEGDDAEAAVVEAWVEKNIVGGVLDAALKGKNVSSRKATATALRQANLDSAAECVESFTLKEYKRFAKMMEPFIASGTEALTEVREAQARMEGLVARARAQGNEGEAKRIESQFRSAIARDLEAVDYDFECPSWLAIKASFYVDADADEDDDGMDDFDGDDDGEEDDTEAAVDVNASSGEILASVAHTLVDARRSKKAAMVLVGSTKKDAVRAARVCAKLVEQGKMEEAAAMVAELRQAAYNVDPDVKPSQVDPSQPVTPGAPNRMMGPPPDAGFSYGMSDEEAEQCATALGCGTEALAWVKDAPKDGEGNIDPTGKWACYTESCGTGPTAEMDLEACKAYLSKRASTVHAALLANPEELRKASVSVDDVVMTLHDSEQESPFWNVIVGGVPTGVIALADQDKPDVIRSTFVTPTYANGIREAMATFGPLKALEQVRYRPWAASYQQTAAVQEVKEQVTAASEKLIAEQVEQGVGDVLDLMLLAHAEFQRNITDVANPLKWAVTERVAEAGVANAAAVAEEALSYEVQAGVDEKGEAVYEDVTSQYFKVLYARAMEFAKMPTEALEHISREIIKRPIVARAGSPEMPSSQTLRERLASANLPISAIPDVASARPAGGEGVQGIDRDALRAGLRLARTR